MSQKSVNSHVKLDDCFGTLATMLSLVSQTPENDKHHVKTLEKLVEDLIFLQTGYYIILK